MRQSGVLGGCAPSFFAQMLLCSFLWAACFPLMKLIGNDVPPTALAAVRGLLGGLALAVWFKVRGQSIRPRGREWYDWLILGLTQGAIPNALIAFAVARISSGLASMIEASCPLLVAVFSHWLFSDERLSRYRAAGLLIGFSGMAILLGPAALTDDGRSLWGILAAIGTAVSYSVGNLYVRFVPSTDPTRLALGQQIFSGLPMLVLTLAVTGPAAFVMVPDHAFTLLIFGLLATALPIVVYMHILHTAGPTLGSMIGYLIPVWTVLMGTLFLNESIGTREITGGLVVLVGVAIVSRTKRRIPAGGISPESAT